MKKTKEFTFLDKMGEGFKKGNGILSFYKQWWWWIL